MSAQQTTVSSGITDLLPSSDIDEFVFEPCGYSMNGLQVTSPCYQSICGSSSSVTDCISFIELIILIPHGSARLSAWLLLFG